MKKNFPDRGMALLAYLEGDKDGDVNTKEHHHVSGDPGGKTSGFGLTERTYHRFCKLWGWPVVPLEERTPEQEIKIFQWFWDFFECDKWDNGADLAVFQFGVNTKPNACFEAIQRACGAKVDGVIGPVTIDKALCMETNDFIEALFDQQIEYYKTKAKGKFLKGLKNRVTKTAEFIEFPYIEG